MAVRLTCCCASQGSGLVVRTAGKSELYVVNDFDNPMPYKLADPGTVFAPRRGLLIVAIAVVLLLAACRPAEAADMHGRDSSAVQRFWIARGWLYLHPL
jgi:hypothetical protein